MAQITSDKPGIAVPSAAAPALPANGKRRRATVPIALVLTLAFIGVTALSGLAVVLALMGSQRTMVGLLRERTEQLVDAAEMRLRDHLAPVRDQGLFLAAAIIDGTIDPADRDQLRAWLTASMAGLSQVAGVTFVTPDLQALRVERRPGGGVVTVDDDVSAMPLMAERMEQLRVATQPFWGDLLWNAELRQPLINLRVPVWRGGGFVGGIGTAVSMGQLSRIVGELSPAAGTGTFVLYDRDFVLAHPRLVDPKNLLLLPGQVLPRLEQVGDRALTGMWTVARAVTEQYFGRDSENIHIATVDGTDYVFVYRDVTTFSDRVLTVGHYFPAQQVYAQTEALRNGAIAAAIALVLALVIGILLGRAITRPMVRLAEAADRIRDFDFEGELLPHSSLREIQHANAAVNASRAALHWFSSFVPRKLVTRLLAEGEQTMQSKRREVTVMFTDIVGFTMEAEDLPEKETAEFLNEHFALVAACIEAEGGVIDKFIGDAVMATWGAIKRIPDHADCAIAAAQGIARALHEDNILRVAQGRKPVRMRIGLHSGPVVVGNIGAPGRVNYTVVGDTVNTAQRMEQLGKEYMVAGEEIVVLATGDTIAALIDRAAFAALLPEVPDRHDVRGRIEPIDVHKLRL